ncbi:hypothetical protein SBA1_400018 [Candidatus Sulfotelmatobacter kueseliae]|uniref:Uncharacterized protein n=1 Tax=Candidatus Sulfotelmatobacter kueseliae TaxID=2042962 RepID=A0A2U3KQC7_9BACT|nr:hypothetical protein SBA1_400018 [Candidatus Sulfotelmatobacter kueseliae]
MRVSYLAQTQIPGPVILPLLTVYASRDLRFAALILKLELGPISILHPCAPPNLAANRIRLLRVPENRDQGNTSRRMRGGVSQRNKEGERSCL